MKLLSTICVSVALASFAMPSQAGGISIGVQESGVNGGALTTVMAGSTTAIGSFSYGVFSFNNVSAFGTTDAGSLFSNTTIGAESAGVLQVFVTLQGITKPVDWGTFSTSLTTNLVPAGWLVTEASYLDMADVAFGQTTLLGSHAFTSIGSNLFDPLMMTGSGLFSLTEVYTIEASGYGVANNTIDVVDTLLPEPGTLTLLGIGLAALGVVRRRASFVDLSPPGSRRGSLRPGTKNI